MGRHNDDSDSKEARITHHKLCQFSNAFDSPIANLSSITDAEVQPYRTLSRLSCG